MTRRALAPTCLCLLAAWPAALAGCGTQNCTGAYIPAFVVILRAADGALPDDLVIRLYVDGELVVATSGLAYMHGFSCAARASGDAGAGGAPAFDEVGCSWSGRDDGPWVGWFEATAAGYKPVLVMLATEADASGCYPIQVGAEAVLHPL